MRNAFVGRVGLGRRRALVLAHPQAPGAQLLGPRLVAGLLGLPDLARELLHLGPQVLEAGAGGPVRHVGLNDGVHLGRLDAAPGQRGLDPVGIVTQHPDIDHSTSK